MEPRTKIYIVMRSMADDMNHQTTYIHSVHDDRDAARVICRGLLLDGFAVRLVERPLITEHY